MALVQLMEKPLLPHGWEVRTDAASGRTYYVDHTTQTTYWELPPSYHENGSSLSPHQTHPFPQPQPQTTAAVAPPPANPEEETIYPLRPKPPQLRQFMDPHKKAYYYRTLVTSTVQKAIALYGIISHTHVLPFVVFSSIVVVLDTFLGVPYLLYGVHKINRTGLGPSSVAVGAHQFFEYLIDALYAAAALVLKNLTGKSSIYDSIQLFLSSWLLALQLWRLGQRLIYAWTDNRCLVRGNQVLVLSFCYMVVLMGGMTAFNAVAGLFLQLFFWCSIVIAYLFYLVLIIAMEYACCIACCFRNNNGVCCCPSSCHLVVNPQTRPKIARK